MAVLVTVSSKGVQYYLSGLVWTTSKTLATSYKDPALAGESIKRIPRIGGRNVRHLIKITTS